MGVHGRARACLRACGRAGAQAGGRAGGQACRRGFVRQKWFPAAECWCLGVLCVVGQCVQRVPAARCFSQGMLRPDVGHV